MTEQQRTEAQLKASLKELNDLKAALDEHAIVAVTDPQGKITYVNDKFCAISKYSRAELLGQDHRIINSGHHSSEFMRGLWTTIARGQVWKGEIKNKARDGSFYWVDTTIVPFLNQEGKPHKYVAIRADITERKHAELQLRSLLKENSDLKSAVDKHAIVAVTDPGGKITYVNDKFCEISKYSRKELLGQDHRILNSGYHPKDFMRDLWTTITGGKVWQGEIKNRAKDGKHYWVDATIVPFLDDRGKPYQYVAIRTDITERKEAEQEILKLNEELEERVRVRTSQLQAANKELESFSYSVSHDLRAPIRHIHGFVGLLSKSAGAELSPQSQRYLDTISRAAIQMGRLIDALLTFSKMGRAEIKQCNVSLQHLLEETVEALQMETLGRQITWKKGRLPEVQADPSLLRQVFINLISNAIKYTRPRQQAEIEIGAEENMRETIIYVRDNGVGFNMEHASKLFGVFQRLHSDEEFEGTGVGLANVHRIIARHGGRTWAEGKVDHGATFYFSLPRGSNITHQ